MVLEIKVHCPGCRAVLKVPLAAAGKHGRCPACQTLFKVPDPDDIVEQTVSTWLDQDLSEMEDQNDEQWKQKLQAEAEEKERQVQEKVRSTADAIRSAIDDHAPTTGRVGTRIPHPPAPPDRPGTGRSATGAPTTTRPARPESPTAGQTTSPTATTVNRPATPTASSASPLPSTSPPRDASPTSSSNEKAAATPSSTSGSDSPATPSPTASNKTHPAEHEPYPHDLVVSVDQQPHLFVKNVTQQGVTLGFDAQFLRHSGFRRSMPVECAFSGETDPEHLVARPLAWLDRSQGQVRHAHELESGHERVLRSLNNHAALIESMGVMDILPEPFNTIVPYFVADHHSGHSLACDTERRPDGGYTCRVLLPDGRYALKWLRNVNGICGRDYELLDADVNHLWQSGWTTLEERVRQRLAGWCEFRPAERFRFYLNDADLTKKDEGLAGIVLTDQRLIYHKYHRRGQVEIGDDTTLTVRPDGLFAGLTVTTEDGPVRAARFHIEDLGRLRDAVKELGVSLTIKED